MTGFGRFDNGVPFFSLTDENSSRNIPLPVAFLDFLEKNGIDPSIYNAVHDLPRYIRVKPDAVCLISEMEDEIGCKFVNVDWLPGFYWIPPQMNIASSNAYRQGKVYGMDASSGAAIIAMGVAPGDHVLDLCAAPGAKLCMIAELLGQTGSLTGVDISRHRLAACRTMLRKYELGDRCRLFVADGTSFSFLPLRSHLNLSHDARTEYCCGELTVNSNGDTYREWTNRLPWKERKKAKKAREGFASVSRRAAEPDLIFYGKHSGVIGLGKGEMCQAREEEARSLGYDKVLVDAECTHDGSVKHVHKFEHWGWDTLQRRVLDDERIGSLTQLQSYKRLQLPTSGLPEVVGSQKPCALIL